MRMLSGHRLQRAQRIGQRLRILLLRGPAGHETNGGMILVHVAPMLEGKTLGQRLFLLLGEDEIFLGNGKIDLYAVFRFGKELFV